MRKPFIYFGRTPGDYALYFMKAKYAWCIGYLGFYVRVGIDSGIE